MGRLFHLDGASAPDETCPCDGDGVAGMNNLERFMFGAVAAAPGYRPWLWLICLGVFSLTASTCLAFQFGSPKYYTVGSQAIAQVAVTADFNNDHNVDIAVGDYLGNKVAILLGNGDGTFQKALIFAVPEPIALAVGDFNEDGLADLAIVEYGGSGDGTLGIYLGEGNGRFRKSATYKLGPESLSVAVGDFNGDGHLDVAALNEGALGRKGSFMIFTGKGDGKFDTSPTSYKLGGDPYSIAAADLNGDGYPDLVVAEYEGECVAVMLNDRKGKFSGPVCYSTYGPSPAVYVIIADLNNDKVPDLAVATPGVYPGFNIFLGDGKGGFGAANYYADTWPNSLTVADFEHTGNLDIVTANPDRSADFFHGNGDGTFQLIGVIQAKYPCGPSVASGDFNNDGYPDVAITMYDKNIVAVAINAK